MSFKTLKPKSSKKGQVRCQWCGKPRKGRPGVTPIMFWCNKAEFDEWQLGHDLNVIKSTTDVLDNPGQLKSMRAEVNKRLASR